MLKAAALGCFPPQNHAGLSASTKALCVHTFISCTDAHDKYSFLPAYVAMKAPLELPGHAWTSVGEAKEGKGCAWIQSNLCAWLQRAQHKTLGGWQRSNDSTLISTSERLFDARFSRDTFPRWMLLKCILLFNPSSHK